MMYKYFNQGFNGNGICRGLGNFQSVWGIVIGIGVIITIALLFYVFVHNNKKKNSASEALETLKLHYVKGEISEEEYLRRKSLIEK